MTTNYAADALKDSSLVRVGGIAVLFGLAIHIIANMFLKEFPPADPSLAELREYLAAEAGTWNVVHGMRYVAIACLAVFLGGVFVRTHVGTNAGGWEYVGLVGGVLQLANLLVTNGIETFAFLDFERLQEQSDLFWLLFNATRVLFNAEIVAWAILIFGFSHAGWISGRIPKLIAILGYAAAAAGLLSGMFVGTVMTTGGWPSVTFEFAALASLLWFLCMGVLMVLRGGS